MIEDAFAQQRAEFAKYHLALTGRSPATAVAFAIDPKVSQLRRVSAICREISDDWEAGTIYLNVKEL